MKILVVDDEIIVARALQRAFKSRGHDVVIAHTGEEGLEQWLKFRPEILLLDVMMPGLTGPQVIEEAKKIQGLSESAHVILMTAHSGVKGEQAAKNLGANDFIQKPFENIFDLVNKIEKLT